MNKSAFTLIELLVVIAIIALLAAILFPVFAAAKASAKASTCISNIRQLNAATLMYANDSDDNYPFAHGSFPNENPSYDARAYSLSWILETRPYTRSTNLTRCPMDASGVYLTSPIIGDSSQFPERSIGFNGFLEAYDVVDGPSVSFSTIRQPSQFVVLGDSTYVVADDPAYFVCADYTWPENSSDSGILLSDPNLSTLLEDPSQARHRGGNQLTYSDGHAKWSPQGTESLQPSLAAQPQRQWRYGLIVDPQDPRNQ